MKKVVVSGASGFIGGALVKELLARGYEVYALARYKEHLNDLLTQYNSLYIFEVSFENYPQVAEIIAEKHFEAFVHMAWAGYGKATNDYYVQMQNVVHTCEAVTVAAELQCKKFVFADSSHEYLTSLNENGDAGACSIYGTAKLCARKMAQTLCHNHNITFNGVIFTNVFGPGDKSQRSTNTLIRKLLKGESLDLIPGDRLYDWTYIDDCVGGVLAVMERGFPQKLYYVGSYVLRPFEDIMKDVRDVIAPNADLNFGKYSDLTFIDYRRINTYGVYQDTGYLPNSDFKAGVIRTAEWIGKQDEMKSNLKNT